MIGKGTVRYTEQDSGRVIHGPDHNQTLYTGSDLVGRWMKGDDISLNYYYIEFTNDSGMAIPTLDASDARAYYQSLGAATGKDILRLPMIVTPKTGTTDATKYASNKVTFFLVANASTGYYGTTFDENSYILGASIVYAPNNTLSNDIPYARMYLPTLDQAGTHTKTFVWDLEITLDGE